MRHQSRIHVVIALRVRIEVGRWHGPWGVSAARCCPAGGMVGLPAPLHRGSRPAAGCAGRWWPVRARSRPVVAVVAPCCTVLQGNHLALLGPLRGSPVTGWDRSTPREAASRAARQQAGVVPVRVVPRRAWPVPMRHGRRVAKRARSPPHDVVSRPKPVPVGMLAGRPISGAGSPTRTGRSSGGPPGTPSTERR